MQSVIFFERASLPGSTPSCGPDKAPASLPHSAAPIAPAQSSLRTLETESPLERATRRIKALLTDNHPLVVAFSAGKDSSALASVTLNAARDLVQAGLPIPPIIVTHSDTGVEQPEIVMLARGEIEKMRRFAKAHGLRMQAVCASPQLNDSFPVRVIGGRALPAFPDTRADCTTDWKIRPNAAMQAQALAQLREQAKAQPELANWSDPVVMTGVRNEESIARDQRIASRGETAEGIWRNELGLLRASPILDWTSDDVWEYLGLCNSGRIVSFSDFSDTMRIYRDAGNSSCVVVADMRMQAQAKPCGTRTGCWACTRVRTDKSMQQMMVSDPQRYGYLQPLARLRDFISNTQYDWSRRTYVGRTIAADGHIEIAADTYSPQMLADLLVYTLSAQALSGVDIISVEQLIAIDARWSLYALWPPFTALKLYHQVLNGAIETAPSVIAHPKTPVPRIGRYWVGTTWQDVHGPRAVAGLRDASAEMFGDECGFDLKTLPNGLQVLNHEANDAFEVDREGAHLFLELESSRLIEEYCDSACADWTWGYKTYLRYGTLRIAKGRSTSLDEILRRSQWRQAHGLHGQQDLASLRQRCTVRYPEQGDLFGQ